MTHCHMSLCTVDPGIFTKQTLTFLKTQGLAGLAKPHYWLSLVWGGNVDGHQLDIYVPCLTFRG